MFYYEKMRLPDTDVRDNIFNIIPEDVLKHAVNNVTSITRPANNVYFNNIHLQCRNPSVRVN